MEASESVQRDKEIADRLKEITKGKCIVQTKNEFLKEMEEWVEE